ncbi:MAG TPA: prepilin-type N-terminal cleavage/methylation domain-containing protein [Verrucomicrobiae bacterium]|nr:prepilin-type N-terminal cleavage/methylation domain-containing protein [Verrucomicrobiae bacterium]
MMARSPSDDLHWRQRPFSPGRSTSRSRAFTLIELLITMVLMVILFTMYHGYASRNYQHEQRKKCEANLQKIYVALQIFGNDHSSRYPEVPGAQTSEQPLDLLVPHYSVDTTIFICPGSKAKALPSGESILQRKISYAYYMGLTLTNAQEALLSDAQANTLSKNIGQTLFSVSGQPPGNNHYKYGGNVLFGDGHVEFSPTNAAFPLVLSPGIILLNPRP